MTEHRIWDPFVRVFHWALVGLFAANALYTNPEKTPHEYIGYTIAALVGLRMIWGLIGSRHARFSDFLPSMSGVLQQITDIATGRHRIHLGHTPLGALMIYNLIATIAGICLTGWMMTTNTFWGVDWVEKTHEVLVTWAEISVVLHVVAVIWESRRTGINLPRAMVTGVKRIPEGHSTDA
ncbi:cytochrome b/b6 domain-containing protein [Mesobacterium sp. TK19101]|uniref:Cytochrome b/b6 domain-containing protein n=1 Tax=Mesobacterium hydrothermale TaxID=3111907 RepID=A0ABU6HFH0_9RHOB|nr:cytochrome b/b6 domain-containing protein [Mesobacterium sp. TK19101]MEC3861121.1 cytochrome b/b6 domain-containing protein [Mesobacterium sp. TK19101]